MSHINIILFQKKLARFVNVTIHKSVFYIIIAFFLLLIPLSFYLIFTSTQNVLAKHKIRNLVKENQSLKQELGVVKSQLDTLSQKLEDLAVLDAQIRVSANLELLPKDLRALGYGGSSENELSASVDNMIERAKMQEQSFRQLQGYLEQQSSLLLHTPSIWPVSGWLSSGFGRRASPFSGNSEYHEGLDIVAPAVTPIHAAADGIVRTAEYKSGWGRVVEIEHGFGYVTFYGHCQSLKVTDGQRVKRGDIIATVGRTGSATGYHLHYGIKVAGSWVNPLNYILTETTSR